MLRNDDLVHRLVEADGRRRVVADDRDLRRPFGARLHREVHHHRHQFLGLVVGGGRGLEDVFEAAVGDQVGVGQGHPGQFGAFRHLGDGQGEAGQPGAEAARQVGLLRHHALRRVLGFFRGVAGIVLDHHQLGAAQGLDAAVGIDLIDRHARAHLHQQARPGPGAGQRHQHPDFHVLRLGSNTARGQGGGAGKSQGGPACDRACHGRFSPNSQVKPR